MNETNNSNLLMLSSDKCFASLEGEGKYVGMPSVFMRLSLCNLTCRGFASADSPHGCDSYVSWSVKNKYTIDELFGYYEVNNHISHLENGAILKITGGEPLIWSNALLNFLKKFKERYKFIPRIDFETNGTIAPSNKFHEVYGATYTVSPKLSNNGDPENKRYIPFVLDKHSTLASQGISIFKFVVNSEEDMNEIQEKYVDEFDIAPGNIWLMPMCGSREEHTQRAPYVAELAKKYYYNFSPRLHLMLWDKALGV